MDTSAREMRGAPVRESLAHRKWLQTARPEAAVHCGPARWQAEPRNPRDVALPTSKNLTRSRLLASEWLLKETIEGKRFSLRQRTGLVSCQVWCFVRGTSLRRHSSSAHPCPCQPDDKIGQGWHVLITLIPLHRDLSSERTLPQLEGSELECLRHLLWDELLVRGFWRGRYAVGQVESHPGLRIRQVQGGAT